ncbi:MAG TPA: MFS transporter [Rhizomicrobium sp.]|jgi:MFS family permease|nr:MFS transporter [Rhizomicrobium sp.]
MTVLNPAREALPPRRTLAVAGAAHALHDGYTDLILVLLPVWQAEFALGYGALALLRGVYSGAMAALQMPSGRLAERWGYAPVLALGTALTALGYMVAGLSGGVAGLFLGLTIGGAGASVQHPIGSAAVARAYGKGARGPLGAYNFSGDLGKAAIPAAGSLLLTMMPWRNAMFGLAGFAALAALAIFALMPAAVPRAIVEEHHAEGQGRGGFALLFCIGVFDTGVRMGFLTFLPFLLKAKGAPLPLIGTALALVFLGGAAGKFLCGWLGARLGVKWTVLATEGGTAILILAVLALPLWPALALLPLLGAMLNGTSSVLYGTVPELARAGRTEQSFALFYTGTIGSGALSPVLYGLLGDAVGPGWATFATAMTALAIGPLMLALAPRLKR